MTVNKFPPQVQCRICGHKHHAPVCCPICKSIGPVYAVLKGSVTTKTTGAA